MKRLLFVLVVFASSLFAQTGLTTIVGSHVSNPRGGTLRRGSITFVPTDAKDQPAQFSLGTSTNGFAVPETVCANISSGAVSGVCKTGGTVTVADSLLTTPNVCYRITVTDSDTGQTFDPIKCVVITSSTFNLDTFNPTTAAPLPPTTTTTTGSISVTGGMTTTGDATVGGALTVVGSSDINPYTDQVESIATATAAVTAKIYKDQEDVHIVVVNDSIGFSYTYGTSSPSTPKRFGALIAEDLGTMYPEKTVTIREPVYVVGNYTAPFTWDTVHTSHTGTGTHTITIDMCGIPGAPNLYDLGDNYALCFQNAPDLLIFEMSTNDLTDYLMSIPVEETMIEQVTKDFPNASVLLISANPANDALYGAGKYASQYNQSVQHQLLAQSSGYGHIDMFADFIGVPSWATTLIDPAGLHPTDAGQDRYRAQLHKALTYHPGTPTRARRQSTLVGRYPQYISNGDFSVWTNPAAAPDGWTLQFVTASQDTVNFNSPNGYSVKLTATGAGTSAGMYQVISNLSPLLGKRIVFNCYSRIASGQPAGGRVGLRAYDGSSVQIAAQDTDVYSSSVMATGAFRWMAASIVVPLNTLTLKAYDWAGDGNTASGVASFDRCSLTEGFDIHDNLPTIGTSGSFGTLSASGPVTLGSSTGEVTIGSDTGAAQNVNIESSAGQNLFINIKRNGVVRNRIFIAGADESFQLQSLDGSGNLLDSPLQIGNAVSNALRTSRTVNTVTTINNGTSAFAFQNSFTYGTAVTATGLSFYSTPSLAALASMSNFMHFRMDDIVLGGGASLANQYGYWCPTLAHGSSNFCFYNSGSAPNSFGSGTSTFGGQIINTLAIGTPPFSVTSTTPVTNLVAGAASKLATARTIAGNSFDGSANVKFPNKFIVQGTADAGLTGAQFLGALSTCLLKNTTTTGVLSCGAAGTDFEAPATTLAGYGITNGVTNTTTVNGKALSSNITLGLASADFANQGTTTTVLHGNGAGNTAFGNVTVSDLGTNANGNGSKVSTGDGTGTSGNLAKFDANKNITNGPTPPAGNIVGDSDTQTLTNKNFTGATNGNTVTLLNHQASTSSGGFTGNAADQTVYTYTLPANTLAAGKGIRVTFRSTKATGTNSAVERVKFGGTNMCSNTGGTANSTNIIVCEIWNVTTSTQEGYTSYAITGSTQNGVVAHTTGAINTTSSVAIIGTVAVTSPDTFNGDGWNVELIQ